MKEGWTYKKLGEVCEKITDGSHNPPKGVACSDNKMLSSQNVRNGYLDLSSIRYLSDEDFQTENKRTNAKQGDVLLTIVGTIGRTCVLTGKEGNITFQRSVAVLKPSEVINSYYLMYCLWSKTESLNKEAQGAAQKGIYLKQLSNVVIAYPSLSEQKNIVDYLDSAFTKIDAMKANAEKVLNEAKALFQASLKEMLEPKEGWEEKTLKETAKYRRGSFPQPYGNKEWYDGEGSMPFVQVAELQEDSFNLISVSKRRISKLAQPLSVFVPAGTVLVSLQGSIGKVAITNYDSYVDRTVAIFQDYKIEIDKTFFAYQLKSRFEIERLKARGTTIKTITKEEFANFSINCPPLSVQQSIVDTLDSLKSKVDKLQENYDKISQECDALKQAILRQVFE